VLQRVPPDKFGRTPTRKVCVRPVADMSEVAQAGKRHHGCNATQQGKVQTKQRSIAHHRPAAPPGGNSLKYEGLSVPVTRSNAKHQLGVDACACMGDGGMGCTPPPTMGRRHLNAAGPRVCGTAAQQGLTPPQRPVGFGRFERWGGVGRGVLPRLHALRPERNTAGLGLRVRNCTRTRDAECHTTLPSPVAHAPRLVTALPVHHGKRALAGRRLRVPSLGGRATTCAAGGRGWRGAWRGVKVPLRLDGARNVVMRSRDRVDLWGCCCTPVLA
jgi:hypothetical protein